MDNNYLIHFGIKGMRWGVRRYQNKDGSLTPAGKKRYMNSPLTKFGKKLAKIQSRKEINKINALEKDIISLNSIKDGLKNKKGRTILSKEDVNKSVNALVKMQQKNMRRAIQFVKEKGDDSYISYDVITGTYTIKQKSGINADLSGKQISNYLREERRIKREM